MNIQNKITSVLFIAILMFTNTANAQIKGTATDEKFGNTTVVFKDTNANDAQILAQLEASMGMGDVVRITVAPPKPKVEVAPVVATKTVAPVPQTIVPAPVMVEKLPVAMINNDTVEMDATEEPVLVPTETPKPEPQAELVKMGNVGEEKVAVAKTTTVKSSTSGAKLGKKASVSKKQKKHKSRGVSLKSKKRSKQKYGCYRF